MKTKHLFVAVLMLLMCLPVKAQQELFSRYGDLNEVSSVYISKEMLEMGAVTVNAKSDIFLGTITKKLNSVQIMSTKDDAVKEQMLKDIRKQLGKSQYKLLMKQKGQESNSEFYINRKGDKISEFCILTTGKKVGVKYVYMEGDMSTKDLQQLLLYYSDNSSTDYRFDGDVEQWLNGRKYYTYAFPEGFSWDAFKERLKDWGDWNEEELKEIEKKLEGLKDLGSLRKLKNVEEVQISIIPDDKKVE